VDIIPVIDVSRGRSYARSRETAAYLPIETPLAATSEPATSRAV
jgi:phosphoribosylformimino-5-aminoimidazole carboxamide ribotide isomerase